MTRPGVSIQKWAIPALIAFSLILVYPVCAQSAGVYSVEGDDLLDQGKYQEALDKYEQAIALEPNLAMAWVGKGLSLNGLERYDDALEAFEKAIAINPGYAKAWYGKGVALYGLGRYEESITAFDRALEIYPEYGYILYYAKANAYYAMDNYSEAIPLYEKALSLQPDYAPGWTKLGDAFSASGDYESAVPAYEKALALNPDDLRADAGKKAALAKIGGVEPTAAESAIQTSATSSQVTPADTAGVTTPTRKAILQPWIVIIGLFSVALLSRFGVR